MSTLVDYNGRQLIPRLLPSNTANFLRLNENSLGRETRTISPFELHNYNNLKSEWRNEKSIILATQILSYENIYDSLGIDTTVLDYLDENYSALNQIEEEILAISCSRVGSPRSILIRPESTFNAEVIIRNIRTSNNIYQRNPISWCDLGYYYTTLGLKDKAARAYKVAINLNNSNRFVVRSAARFFIHIGELDFAHNILLKSPAIIRDPGIMSAEIALSEIMDRKSRYTDKGVSIVMSNENSTPENNELFAQIATLEFAHGKKGKGRKIINKCLINLTENSLAQLEYLSKYYDTNSYIDGSSLSVSCQYEALTRSNFSQSKFRESLDNAKKWLRFQPFSSTPALFASFLSSIAFCDYKESISIIQSSLKSSSGCVALMNNLAYSYAWDGQINEAISTLSRIDMKDISADDRAILTATHGLVAYKLGNIEYSKKCYQTAISYFRSTHNKSNLAIALYNYAIVLSEFDKIASENAIHDARDLMRSVNMPELNCLIQNSKLINFDGLV